MTLYNSDNNYKNVEHLSSNLSTMMPQTQPPTQQQQQQPPPATAYNGRDMTDRQRELNNNNIVPGRRDDNDAAAAAAGEPTTMRIITNHTINNGNIYKTNPNNPVKSEPNQPTTGPTDATKHHVCHNNNNINTTTTTTTNNNNHHHHHYHSHHLNQSGPTNQTNDDNLPKLKKNANLDTVHVIVGNEACDLDSAVSCLLMFHILTKMSDGINGKDKAKTLYIPLLNTTRDSLEAKSEVLWFLKKTLNIDKSYLTCKDDIDWREIKKTGVEVLITLVDHNYSEEFEHIGKVVEIVDHHQIMNRDWLLGNHASIRLTLDPTVGSCTTLVAERLFHIYAEHHVADEILLLIYGTVLLDTICLSEKAKRFTRRDLYLLKKLDSLMGSKRPSRDELYKQLVEVKNTTKELNFEKLMKRDLKVFKDINGLRVGIASLFGMAAKEALGLAANINLDLFFQQHKYEAFIIMGLVTDLDHSDSISRDLVVISANDRLFQELTRTFEAESSKLDVDIIDTNHGNLEDCNLSSTTTTTNSKQQQEQITSPVFYKARIYLQKNVSSSRKVVAPLVLKVLHDGVYRDQDTRHHPKLTSKQQQSSTTSRDDDQSIVTSRSVEERK